MRSNGSRYALDIILSSDMARRANSPNRGTREPARRGIIAIFKKAYRAKRGKSIGYVDTSSVTVEELPGFEAKTGACNCDCPRCDVGYHGCGRDECTLQFH